MMWKILKKAASFAVAAAMATGTFTVLPENSFPQFAIAASAEEVVDSYLETAADFQYTISNGEVTLKEYIGDDTVVTIPEVIDGYPVTGLGINVFLNFQNLTSVTIPDSFTSIGENAFTCCENLTSVTIPDNITSIGNNAFASCKSLTSVTIPDSVTSLGYSAFFQCVSLTEVVVPDGVTTIRSNAFSECESLKSITIPDSVTTIEDRAFYYCPELTRITIPEAVTSIGEYAFDGCDKLIIFVYPNSYARTYAVENELAFATIYESGSNAADFEYSIADNEATVNKYIGTDTGVIIPATIEGCPVTAVGAETFSNRSDIKRIIMPDGIKSIGDMAFLGCSKLTEIDIPESVDTFGTKVFSDCDSLREVVIPYGTTTLDYAFEDCFMLNSVTIPDSVTSLNGTFSSCSHLTNVVIPDSVTVIGDEAFYNCQELPAITIPDSVTTIGDDAFNYCLSFTDITIPDSVTSIGKKAFYWCKKLESIKLSNNLTILEKGTFMYCESLKNITIPSSVITIGDGVFQDCTNLENVTISESVTSIGDVVFWDCDNLKEIKVDPDNKFYCSYEGVLYNKDMTELVCVPGGMSGEFTVPDSVTFIGYDSFYGTGLTSVTVSDSVTEIGQHAFAYCTDLRSLTIPKSVTTIWNNTFFGCQEFTIYGYKGSYAEFYATAMAYPFVALEEEHTHTYSTEWKSDETNHWYECECGEKADSAAHTESDWIIDEEATTEATGSKHKECTVCKFVTATEEIPVKEPDHEHSFSTEWKSDEANHWYECECGEKSDSAAHTESDWIIDEEATTEATGSKHKECTVCKFVTATEEIPVKIFDNGYLVSDGTTETRCKTWKEALKLFNNRNTDYIVTVYGTPEAENMVFPSVSKAKSLTIKGHDDTAKMTISGTAVSVSCEAAFENITIATTNARGFAINSTKVLTLNNFKAVKLNSLKAKDLYIESDHEFDSTVTATNLFMGKCNVTANKNFTVQKLSAAGGSLNIVPTSKTAIANIMLIADSYLNYMGENYIPVNVTGTVTGGKLIIGLDGGSFANGDILVKAAKALSDSFAINEASDPTTADVKYTLSKQKTDIVIAAEAILLENEDGAIGRYALWAEAMAKIEALNKSASEYTVTIFTDLSVNSVLKMPKRGSFANLTVKGTGTETITFTGAVTLTGNTVFKDINIDSAKKANNGMLHNKFNITASAFKLVLENVNNNAPYAQITNITASGKSAETALVITDTEVMGNITAAYAEIECAEVKGNVTATYLKADNLTVKGNLNVKSGLEMGKLKVMGIITADNIRACEGAKLTIVKGKNITIGKNGFTADSEKVEAEIIGTDGMPVELMGETVFVSAMNAAYNDNFTISEANTSGRNFIIIKSGRSLTAASENGLAEVITGSGALGKFRSLAEAMAEITARNMPTENYTIILREDTAQFAKLPLPSARKYASVTITSEKPVTINTKGAILLTGDLTIDENITVNTGTAAAVTAGKYNFILKGKLSCANAENEIKVLTSTGNVVLERDLTITGAAKAGKIILADDVKLTLGASLAAEIEAGEGSVVSYTASKSKMIKFTDVMTPVTVEIDGVITEGMQVASIAGKYSAPVKISGSDMTVVKSGVKLVAVAVPVKLSDGETERLYDTAENAIKDIALLNNPSAEYTITISGDANGEFVRARLTLPTRNKYASIRFVSESAVVIRVTNDILLTGDLIIGENVTLKKTDRNGNDAVLKITSPKNSGFAAYEENGGRIIYEPFTTEDMELLLELKDSVIYEDDSETSEETDVMEETDAAETDESSETTAVTDTENEETEEITDVTTVTETEDEAAEEITEMTTVTETEELTEVTEVTPIEETAEETTVNVSSEEAVAA